MKSIAFCFLLYDKIVHQKLWERFFEHADKRKYKIYAHTVKTTKNTPRWIKPHIVKRVKTGWCHEGLVTAFIQMLKKARRNKNNQYFILLSGECIPLYNFNKTYRKITSSPKGRIQISVRKHPESGKRYNYASQWIILTRYLSKWFVNMLNVYDLLDSYITNELAEVSCPDELYPIYWFEQIFGRITSRVFKKLFINKAPTYTKWIDTADAHPIRFTNSKINKEKGIQYNYQRIYKSGALFARKFSKPAVQYLIKKKHLY